MCLAEAMCWFSIDCPQLSTAIIQSSIRHPYFDVRRSSSIRVDYLRMEAAIIIVNCVIDLNSLANDGLLLL